jgi:hypothetical protein
MRFMPRMLVASPATDHRVIPEARFAQVAEHRGFKHGVFEASASAARSGAEEPQSGANVSTAASIGRWRQHWQKSVAGMAIKDHETIRRTPVGTACLGLGAKGRRGSYELSFRTFR